MTGKKPLKATDKRRGGIGDNVVITVRGGDGQGNPLIDLFNDRRRPNGVGKRISNGVRSTPKL